MDLTLLLSLSQVIAEAAFPDSNGELSVSLLAAGHYEVQVIIYQGDCSVFYLSHCLRCLEPGM